MHVRHYASSGEADVYLLAEEIESTLIVIVSDINPNAPLIPRRNTVIGGLQLSSRTLNVNAAFLITPRADQMKTATVYQSIALLKCHCRYLSGDTT